MGAEGGSSEPPPAVDGGAVADGGGETVAVNIRCSNGSKFTVRTCLDSTVGSFKALVAQNSDVPANQQRLIYKGRILKDDQTLLSCGLQGDHTVHMVRGSAPSSASPAVPAANSGSPTTTPAVTRGVGSNNSPNLGGAGLGASLFPGLGSNPLGGGNATSGLFGAGLPDFEQAQQQLAQNPSMIRDMMNTPAIQNLLNNPELMRTLIMSNPQMRELVDRNPELGHVLNDPSILRQTLEAARNPELMREMMRNTDRAMSNIESTPEGFNMLRRMYENVQEPFLNATTMSGNTDSNSHSNPFAALLGNQGAVQGRDASNNPSTTSAETGTGNSVPNANPLPNPWSGTGGQTTAPGTTNSTGNTGAPGLGGLGGLGLLGMDPALGTTPDASQLNQLLQNPAVSQMMEGLLSNPQYMNQIINLNPQLRSMLDMNPQMREMLQNPEFLRQLTSPETMQQMMALQQSLFSQLNRNTTSQDSGAATTGNNNNNNAGLDLLMNMFGNLGTGGLSGPNQPNVPPEELYATQLQQLQEMGFFDREENIRALRAAHGNVHAAVERLLGNNLGGL
ncbi:PREDICTED: ubiquitin domain-containing protein DSK2b-like isoform X2 [Tarenaya hassleriana]|uniref:ubiquitin domain-containing protein DSK2b-like isoform X2 n=1 Tax=Tarenaya hassleriana TaxID=28532 RepID=UPI00053C1869|nr:PREDICTED: ubiquitin domain-containing protein DSK2b-like isoform X2 [Tarenaya hassleriana]